MVRSVEPNRLKEEKKEFQPAAIPHLCGMAVIIIHRFS